MGKGLFEGATFSTNVLKIAKLEIQKEFVREISERLWPWFWKPCSSILMGVSPDTTKHRGCSLSSLRPNICDVSPFGCYQHTQFVETSDYEYFWGILNTIFMESPSISSSDRSSWSDNVLIYIDPQHPLFNFLSAQGLSDMRVAPNHKGSPDVLLLFSY